MVPEAQREHGASAAADAGVAESAPLLTLDADCAASVSLTQTRGGEVVGEGEEDAGEDEEGLSSLCLTREKREGGVISLGKKRACGVRGL